MKPICIIPARSGSKRIKNKNIKLFYGKPIIYYSIIAALKSKCFSDVYVSTDSSKIKNISEKFGAKVKFLRSKKLSGDKINVRPVIIDALNKIYPKGTKKPKFICYMSATAPFITTSDIKKGSVNIKKKNVNFSFTITSFDYPIFRALRLSRKKKIKMLYSKFRNTRSQDIEKFYHDAGQFYWAKSEALFKNLKTFSEHSIPIYVERHRAVDIDTPEDWKQAEIAAKYLFKK